MSQKELAIKTGLSLRAIQKIIHNNSSKVETIEKIAQVLQVEPSIFFLMHLLKMTISKNLKLH